MKRFLFTLAVLLLAAPASPATDRSSRRRVPIPIPDQYIVVLEDDAAGTPEAPARSGLTVSIVAVDMAARYGGTVFHFYETALKGFAIRMPERAAQRLAADPRVSFVEQDSEVLAVATQSPATWGIDRIDERSPAPQQQLYVQHHRQQRARLHRSTPASGRRTRSSAGARQRRLHRHQRRPRHRRLQRPRHPRGRHRGRQHLRRGQGAYGCTRCGCSAARAPAAPRASSPASTGWPTTGVLPAVANMSLGGGASSALDAAVNGAINRSVTFAVAAGNSNANACNSSPARVPAAITVGSTTSTRRAVVLLELRDLRRHLRPRLEHHLRLVVERHRDEHHQRHVHGLSARGRRGGAVPGHAHDGVAGHRAQCHRQQRDPERHHQPRIGVAQPPAVLVDSVGVSEPRERGRRRRAAAASPTPLSGPVGRT